MQGFSWEDRPRQAAKARRGYAGKRSRPGRLGRVWSRCSVLPAATSSAFRVAGSGRSRQWSVSVLVQNGGLKRVESRANENRSSVPKKTLHGGILCDPWVWVRQVQGGGAGGPSICAERCVRPLSPRTQNDHELATLAARKATGMVNSSPMPSKFQPDEVRRPLTAQAAMGRKPVSSPTAMAVLLVGTLPVMRTQATHRAPTTAVKTAAMISA